MTEPLNLRTDVVRQHTVPRFLLKHFSKPVKGKRQRLQGFEGQWNENVRLWYNLLIIIQYTKVPFQGPFRML